MSDFITQEFLNDFYQEAQEYLEQINQSLLELEQIARRAEVDLRAAERKSALVEALFRSYHTLKGLCGMVGLEAGATLGHALESTLRDVQKGRLQIDADLIDLLLEGSHVLAAVIESVQDDPLPTPDVSDLVARLEQARGNTSTQGKSAPASAPSEAPVLAQKRAADPSAESLLALPAEFEEQMTEADWHKVKLALDEGSYFFVAIFEPSEEKAARGVNVNLVREKLQKAGVLIKAVPIIRGRVVRFGFLVASDSPLDAAAFPEVSLQPVAVSKPQVAEASRMPSLRREEPSSQIRVNVERLDDLMALVGDLVVSRSRLAVLIDRLNGRLPLDLREALSEEIHRMARQLRNLRQAVMRVRLVPLVEVFSRMPLAVRDVARATGKQVRLVVQGEDTEIDKHVADRLLDPLLHLVRNAVTHGIEPPAERRAAGKPEEGVITLRGRAEGDLVVVEVSDDGRGVDLESVAQKAASLGWLKTERSITVEKALEFMTRSGFSTRDQADLGSGRGVGMDVVAQTVAELGGTLTMDTTPGQGTTFTLRLPLTVTIADALLVEVAGRTYAIPIGHIRQALEIEPERVVRHRGVELISLQGKSLPLISLATLFGLPSPEDGLRYGLRVLDRFGEAVLQVDRLLDIHEVVVRPITDPLIAQPGVGGVTELGDGRVVLVLDINGLLAFVRQRREVGHGKTDA